VEWTQIRLAFRGHAHVSNTAAEWDLTSVHIAAPALAAWHLGTQHDLNTSNTRGCTVVLTGELQQGISHHLQFEAPL